MLIGPEPIKVVYFKSKFNIINKKNADYSLFGWRLGKIVSPKYDVQRFNMKLKTVSSHSSALTQLGFFFLGFFSRNLLCNPLCQPS